MSDAARDPLSRRQFLKGAVAAPCVITSAALGAAGRPPASERLVMGGIGLGGRGGGDLRWLLGEKAVQFVAVCDVKRPRREATKNMVDARYGNTDCATYRDLRELLAVRGDIDAMLIATGDRWHALASILAMRAGKDVYCEKPGTLTVAEGQALVETARQYGQVFQTGTQRLSEANFVFATELARNGLLGDLHTVRAHLWPRVQDVTRNDMLPPQPEPPREELDWDLWLGPVPWRPYNRAYLGGCGAWGIYWDLAAGVAGWGSHTIIQCQFAARAEYTSPVEYVYPGNSSGDGMVMRFSNGVKLVLQFQGWRGSCGVRFEGSKGWASVADGYSRPDLSSPALGKDFRKVISEYVARCQRPLNHMQDFLSCVRSRRPTVANPQAMHRSMTTNHAINICLALKRNLRWDPAREEFVNDPEANRYLSRALRQPWRL
jgi:predicted dehydrogenase